jgi:hypothetical protein
MAQTVRVIDNIQLPANTIRRSAQRTLPAGTTMLDLQMVLATSSPNWDDPSVAGGVFEMMIERINAGGQPELLIAQTVATGNALAVGQRNARTNALPQIGIERQDLGGMVVQAFARSSVAVFISFNVIIG